MGATDWNDRCLSEIEPRIWDGLAEGVVGRRSAFRTPVLATVRGDGPRARVVVLRRVDRGALLLQCHTDLRSQKVHDLLANPLVMWHFYDPEVRIQLCIEARATVHTQDPVALEAWENTDTMARRCYLSTLAPGAETPEKTSGLPAHLQGKRPEMDESEAGYEHFTVIRTRVHSLHWLLLRSRGNVAARFDYDGEGLCGATWVAP